MKSTGTMSLGKLKQHYGGEKQESLYYDNVIVWFLSNITHYHRTPKH